MAASKSISDDVYTVGGDMENRIKEQQLGLLGVYEILARLQRPV